MEKSISIGSDHAGYAYKQVIKSFLSSEGYDVLDMGTDSADSVDYPDFVHPVAESIKLKQADQGIVLCGSGNGVAITANKHQHIRAALCWTDEIASLARQHNDANVLAIPCRFVSEELAIQMVKTFLNTDFEGGRHQKRVEKIRYC
ncbi:MAG: ribose 5-phosphate isomerase B [Saprospiraceae bacterium]|nr:ribose 5-phosphate isomerase B [Saprospiraceae bacterium]